MIRSILRHSFLGLATCLLALAFAAPASADGLLPFFAGGDAPPAASPRPSADLDAPARNPWEGLTMGSEVMGVSGMGKGSRGGFGGDVFVGYSRELDNNVVLGVRASSGYMPGISNYGPRGYNFGMAEATVGYDMGRFKPYVSVGIGTASAGIPNGLPGLNSVNGLGFPSHGQSVTLTKVGAGFDYAVTDNLHVGVNVSAVQARGGFGPPMPPQPGQ